jgi:hypothetical protein
MTEREAEEQLAEGDLQVLKGHMAKERPPMEPK